MLAKYPSNDNKINTIIAKIYLPTILKIHITIFIYTLLSLSEHVNYPYKMPVRGKMILHVEIRDTKADTSKMRLCRESRSSNH